MALRRHPENLSPRFPCKVHDGGKQGKTSSRSRRDRLGSVRDNQHTNLSTVPNSFRRDERRWRSAFDRIESSTSVSEAQSGQANRAYECQLLAEEQTCCGRAAWRAFRVHGLVHAEAAAERDDTLKRPAGRAFR